MKITNGKKINGYTLIELVITLTVLSVLALGTIPLVQNSVRRQKELRLREVLRQIRAAIDEFKRDSIGACPLGAQTNPNVNPTIPNQIGSGIPADPRSRVVIDDCKIFDTENLDRYPPTLEILVEGVKVKSRTPATLVQQGGSVFDQRNATDINSTEDEGKTKKYLREMPVDPITGKSDTWQLRSSFQDKDATSWDEVNVFDVRSGAEGEAMNGEKYSEW
jgi:general secretion pathway protein G